MGGIRPQGGYLAKRCLEAVQLDVLRPCKPLPDSSFMTMLAEDGIAFEARIFERIVAVVPRRRRDRQGPAPDRP